MNHSITQSINLTVPVGLRGPEGGGIGDRGLSGDWRLGMHVGWGAGRHWVGW